MIFFLVKFREMPNKVKKSFSSTRITLVNYKLGSGIHIQIYDWIQSIGAETYDTLQHNMKILKYLLHLLYFFQLQPFEMISGSLAKEVSQCWYEEILIRKNLFG